MLKDAEIINEISAFNIKNMEIKKVSDFLYEKETYDIRGACMEIWKKFGSSFKESIVDNALTIVLEKRGYKVDNQKRINIYFENKKVGTYVPDKIVNNIILLELKCKPYLIKEDEKQFWRYLKASDYKLGLLINFGTNELEIKRRVYDKAREKEIQRNSA